MNYLPQDNVSNVSQTPSQIKRSRIFDNPPSAPRNDVSASIDRPQKSYQQYETSPPHIQQTQQTLHKSPNKSVPPLIQSHQVNPNISQAQQPYGSFAQSQHTTLHSRHYKTQQFQTLNSQPRQQNSQTSQINQSHLKQSQQIPVVSPYNEQHLSETCPTHSEFVMTNICCSKNCMEPLCPRCIKTHLSYHREYGTPHQIEHIDDKRQEAIIELQNDRHILEKERELLGHFNEQGKQELIQICHNRLQESKAKVQKKVDMFFAQFENQLSEKIQSHKIINPGEIKNLNPRIDQFIRELEAMENQLKSTTFISELLKVLTGEIGNEYNNIHEEVDESIEHYIQGLVNLSVDDTKLDQIDTALSQYLKIEPYHFDHEQISHKKQHRKQPQQQQTVKKQIQPYQKQALQQSPQVQQQHQQVKLSSGQKPLPLTASPSQIPQHQSQQFYEPVTHQSVANDYQNIFNNESQQIGHTRSQMGTSSIVQPVEIDMPDYFDPECTFQYLHFFQDNSKTIKFIDLKNLSKDPNSKQFKSTELDIKFKIPLFSRSIITPYGDIILTGGLSAENRNHPTASAYVLDYKRTDFKYLPSMHCDRSSHGICYMNNQIYVVGGETKDGPTNRCEKFDLTQNKWIEIAPLNVPATECCIASFGNRDIYKFGGKQDAFTQSTPIERYNSVTDQWDIVKFNFSHELFSKIPNQAQASQINQNEIIILGGNIEHSNLGQCIVFQLDQEEENLGYLYPGKPLPREGTFWYSPIIQQNVLFNLINVPIETNPEHSYFGKKHFMAFQGKTWKELA